VKFGISFGVRHKAGLERIEEQISREMSLSPLGPENIYRTARFQVQPESLQLCQEAIRGFVSYVKDNEPRTRFYISLQSKDDPTQFLHFMIFEDEMAMEKHEMHKASAGQTPICCKIRTDCSAGKD
jgi:quinol monooxygenase YgiN